MTTRTAWIGITRLAAVAALAGAAACVPKSEPAPEPEPQAQPAPTPAPRPLPPPPPRSDWRDLPLTPGGWYYSSRAGGSQALFGPANSEASFILRCDLGRRQVTLSREGAANGAALTVRTSFGARSLPATAQAEPLPYLSASLGANDRFLDSIAFSRGRFTVEAPGLPTLIVPAWAEPGRVIEDCRS